MEQTLRKLADSVGSPANEEIISLLDDISNQKARFPNEKVAEK